MTPLSLIGKLTDKAVQLVSEGKDPHDAANVIAGGRLLAFIEDNFDEKMMFQILDEDPGDMVGLLKVMVAMQKERRQGVETKLDVQKFRRETAELFLDWYADKRAREIAESKEAQPVKLDKMVRLMFGDRPS